jgi:hypothetical protein
MPQGVMRVVWVSHGKDGTVGSASQLLVFPTALGANTYLNVIDEGQAKLLKEKGWDGVGRYLFLKYEREGDTLLLWAMDDDAKKRAIQEGKIKGVIEKRPNSFLSDRVTLTDTTENVARFVTRAGDSLFEKDATMRLERVK